MLPLLPDSEGSVREERRIVDEVRKILQDEGLMISGKRRPVHRYSTVMPRWSTLKHCVRWRQKKRVMRLLRAKILCSEENEFPTQVGEMLLVVRIFLLAQYVIYGMPEQVQFWSVADNVRFGGALMAVKIAEKLVQEHLY